MTGRKLALAALAMIAWLSAGTTADAAARSRPPAKWCLRGVTGNVACLYNTIQQCRMAASGTGGSCHVNPRYPRPR